LKERVPIQEDELLNGLTSRDQRAFATLYDTYAPALYGIILRIVGDDAEAENLLQDCFVKVWRNIGQYDPAKGRLFTWLLHIARNTALSFLRARQQPGGDSIQPLDAVVYTAIPQTAPIEPNQIGIAEAVGQLDPKIRQVIDLIYFLGYTQQEVADALNLPLGTVKTRTRTGLQQLRQHLGPL
jgi:RNA polymerase sigma factor (sigma-70 family)